MNLFWKLVQLLYMLTHPFPYQGPYNDDNHGTQDYGDDDSPCWDDSDAECPSEDGYQPDE